MAGRLVAFAHLDCTSVVACWLACHIGCSTRMGSGTQDRIVPVAVCLKATIHISAKLTFLRWAKKAYTMISERLQAVIDPPLRMPVSNYYVRKEQEEDAEEDTPSNYLALLEAC